MRSLPFLTGGSCKATIIGGVGRENKELMSERNTSQLPRLLCCTMDRERETRQPVVGEEGGRCAPLVGQARIIKRGGRGAGGHLGERAGSTWSRADNSGGNRGTVGVRGNNLEGRKEAADRGGGGGAWGLSDFGFVFCCVHLSFIRGGADWGGAGGRGVALCAFGASGA